MSSCRFLLTATTAGARGCGSLLPRSHVLAPSRFTAAADHSNHLFRQQQVSFLSTKLTTPITLSWLPTVQRRSVPIGTGYSGGCVMSRTNVSYMPVLPIAQSSLTFQQQQIRLKHSIKTNKSVAKRFRTRGNGSLKRAQSGRQHNTGKQSRSRSNRLGQSAMVSNKKQERKLKQLMGVF